MIELMEYCNNYFKFSIEPSNVITFNGKTITGYKGTYLKGQYILINQTILNNGLYLITNVVGNAITVDTELCEEVTKCIIYGLNVPKDFIVLSKEYNEYKTLSNNKGDLISENFEGYSYTRATNKEGRPLTPIEVFADRLKPFRKMYDSRMFKVVY